MMVEKLVKTNSWASLSLRKPKQKHWTSWGTSTRPATTGWVHFSGFGSVCWALGVCSLGWIMECGTNMSRREKFSQYQVPNALERVGQAWSVATEKGTDKGPFSSQTVRHMSVIVRHSTKGTPTLCPAEGAWTSKSAWERRVVAEIHCPD